MRQPVHPEEPCGVSEHVLSGGCKQTAEGDRFDFFAARVTEECRRAQARLTAITLALLVATFCLVLAPAIAAAFQQVPA